MKRTLAVTAVLALSAGLAWAAARAQDKPEIPKPVKEHEFLKKFEGTWDSKMSMRHAPDQPWAEVKGTEQARMYGEFWVVSEMRMDSSEMPMQGLGTTGYDPFKKKYIVTYIGSMSPSLAVGEGTVNGQTLTTEVKSTDCQTGQPLAMTMVQEFKDPSTLIWTMRMKGKDGKEFECMKGEMKKK